MYITDHLHTGVPAVIQIQGYSGLKLTTFIRGYKNKAYIIVDHPLHHSLPVNIGDSPHCIVRFIDEGKVIGFRSMVIAATRTPDQLLFLQFPTTYETSLLRKSDRYPVSIEAVCSSRRLGGDVGGRPRANVLNLSKGGCLLETSESCSLGEILFLTVFLPEQGRINDVEVEVKRCDKKDGNFYLGLSFMDLMDPGYEQIKGYLNLLESYQVRA